MESSRRQLSELEPVALPEPAAAEEAAPALPVTSSEGFTRSAAAADVRSRGAMIGRLQRASGNAAVARLLHPDSGPARSETRTETRIERLPFHASIRRAPSMPGAATAEVGAAPAGRSDAMPGAEHGAELHGLFEALAAGGPAQVPAPPPAGGAAGAPPAAPAPEAAAAAAVPEAPPEAAAAPAAAPAGTSATPAPAGDGAPISVPDIEIPMLATLGKSDAVAGAFAYSGSIARGGPAPSGFGVTHSFDSKLTGITITPKTGTFDVAATLEHPIKYEVRSGTGPENQKDIPSETDAKITKTNYPTVVSDLTPNMSDLNGRPPRTKFWAEDLTLKHELVHANDDKANGPAAMNTAKTWLNGQTAANEAGVRVHLTKIPIRFADALLAALSTEDGEKHAYGDGAPSYKARADAIKAKGTKGDYV